MMRELKSMELTSEQSYDSTPVAMSKPSFPYGLNLCLTDAEIEKLGIDPTKATVDGYIMVHGMARITSVNCDKREDGDHYRIEAQIEKLAVDGDDEEAEGEVPKRKSIYKSMASA